MKDDNNFESYDKFEQNQRSKEDLWCIQELIESVQTELESLMFLSHCDMLPEEQLTEAYKDLEMAKHYLDSACIRVYNANEEIYGEENK